MHNVDVTHIDQLCNTWKEWKPSGDQDVIQMGPVLRQYSLIRAGSSDNVTSFPWTVAVQKKMVKVRLVPGAIAVKAASCARPATGNQPFFCCVNKWIEGRETGLSVAENKALRNSLLEI